MVRSERLAWAGPTGGERAGSLQPGAAAGDEPTAGVLVLHLEPALAAPAAQLACRLARAGHAALVPESSEPGAARGDREALADLEGALSCLARRDDVDDQRLAVVGLGAAATLAFLLACTSRRVAAAAVVGGPLARAELSAAHPFQPLELALNLSCPLLVLCGAGDPATPPAERDALRRVLSQAMKSFELDLVEGAGPRFLDPAAPGYHPPAAEAVAERVARFLTGALPPS